MNRHANTAALVIISFLIAVFLLTLGAHAQPSPPAGLRFQTLPVTANDCVKVVSSTTVADTGSPCGGATVPAAGLVNSNGTTLGNPTVSSPLTYSGTTLSCPTCGTASPPGAGLVYSTGSALSTATVSSPVTYSAGTVACATCYTTSGGALTGAVTITGSAPGLQVNTTGGTIPAGGPTAIQSRFSGNGIARIVAEAFNGLPSFRTVRWDGSTTTPTAVLLNDSLGQYVMGGYNGSSASGIASGIQATATENWAVGAQGTQVEILTTTNATATALARIRFENDGGITVPSTVTGGDQGAGTINATGLYVGGSAVLTAASLGTSGGTIPYFNGSNTWSGTQTFGAVVNAVSTQSGTSYTLASTDCGSVLRMNNASAIALTVPNSLAVGCQVAVMQAGAGQVTVSVGSGATLHSAHSYTKTFGQYAVIGLTVDTNAGGTAADYILTGDGA